MKKVAFITRHIVSNYGSVLQAYATQEALRRLGFECVCIDYFRTDELPENLVSTRLSTSKWNKNPLTRAFFMLTQKPVYALADKRFAQYRRIVDVTGRTYNSVEELEAEPPEADIYLTGSDQVWNTVVCGELDRAYFLSFAPENKRRLAYSASFGGNLSEAQKAFIKPLVSRYDAISVRESSGVELLAEMGVSARQTLDPTFLLDRQDWEKMIPKREKRERFALVYQLHPNKAFDKYAKEFSKRAGLKLFRISHCFHHAVRSGKFICCPDFGEFLWHIKNADVFLTDSFHGTAFSIGLNTPFVDVLPDKYSERIHSVLRLIGCENRIVTGCGDFSLVGKQPDWERVNRVIAEERKKSIDILKEMLGDPNE